MRRTGRRFRPESVPLVILDLAAHALDMAIAPMPIRWSVPVDVVHQLGRPGATCWRNHGSSAGINSRDPLPIVLLALGQPDSHRVGEPALDVVGFGIRGYENG